MYWVFGQCRLTATADALKKTLNTYLFSVIAFENIKKLYHLEQGMSRNLSEISQIFDHFRKAAVFTFNGKITFVNQTVIYKEKVHTRFK